MATMDFIPLSPFIYLNLLYFEETIIEITKQTTTKVKKKLHKRQIFPLAKKLNIKLIKPTNTKQKPQNR